MNERKERVLSFFLYFIPHPSSFIPYFIPALAGGTDPFFGLLHFFDSEAF